MENEQRPCQPSFQTRRLTMSHDGPRLSTGAKPKADQGQNEKTFWTYVAQICDNLPDPSFVQPGERPSVFPKKMSKIAKLAQLCLHVQGIILFPTVDVRQHVWMPRA